MPKESLAGSILADVIQGLAMALSAFFGYLRGKKKRG